MALASTTAIALALALLPTGAAHASAEAPASETTATTNAVQVSLEEFEGELALLATLPEDELRATVNASIAAYQAAESGTSIAAEPPTRVKRAVHLVPVIVWAIGCGFAGISSVATNSWSNANSAAWAIAGILIGCIPGVGQAAVVKVILANKRAIANALKAVGLTAPALALTGSSPK